MAKYYQVTDDGKKYSIWIEPTKKFRMACCDCGLIHDVQFQVIKGKIMFRLRRNKKATAAKRRRK